LKLDPSAAYVHITSNNTIAGSQWMNFPDTGSVPLVADMSSDIMWRPMDVSKFGLIYAGAQKNIGPSGVTLVIADKELIKKGRTDIPTIFRYSTHEENNSLYNTVPTFGVYMLRNVLAAVKDMGGLAAMEKQNLAKAEMLYAAMDGSSGFYRCPVEDGSRSVMNVVFNLPTEEQEADFIKKATAKGLVGLKGHRSVGGIRASIYNAAPLAWVEALVSFMKEYK
jgi:phosphoserine aminotransferase